MASRSVMGTVGDTGVYFMLLLQVNEEGIDSYILRLETPHAPLFFLVVLTIIMYDQ